MCGIAVSADGIDSSTVDEALARLTHRGPDADGTATAGDVVLGHRRLSIVDLDGGDQPLHGEGGVVLVANGEVYNAPALREELGPERFRTQSDNEVILHLLDEHGLGAVDRLEGMYAFAFVGRDGELLLGRDAIGIKPLYLGRHEGALVATSELRALPPGTVDVAPLRPGTTWSSHTGTHSHWDVPDPAPVEGDLETHAARVREALGTAVERRMLADVPVGAFLSGGLDSSAIVALLAERVEELHTFSVGLEGSPDLAAARVVAEHVGTAHHERVLTPDEVVEALPSVVRALESFDQDLVRSAVPTWFTAELAAQHLKVIMTGEGADELFAGYTYHADIPDPASLHVDARRSIAELHHVNLQRVDRLTMAHSLEARVPFLDLDLVEVALSIPAELRMPSVRGREKAVLRVAVEDLLPHDIVWRGKAQFDEGSGMAELLPQLTAEIAADVDVDAYRSAHPDVELRSPEECHYHQVLQEALEDPSPTMSNVGRWAQRG